MALKPLADRIVVRPLDAQDKTKSGLVLPDSAKEKPQEGKVIAVGTGRLLDDGAVKSLEIKNGDTVSINAEKKELKIHLTAQEIKARLKKFKAPPLKYKKAIAKR